MTKHKRSKISNEAKRIQKQQQRQEQALKALYAYEYQACYDLPADVIIARARQLARAFDASPMSIENMTRYCQLSAISDYCRDEGIGLWPEEGNE